DGGRRVSRPVPNTGALDKARAAREQTPGPLPDRVIMPRLPMFGARPQTPGRGRVHRDRGTAHGDEGPDVRDLRRLHGDLSPEHQDEGRLHRGLGPEHRDPGPVSSSSKRLIFLCGHTGTAPDLLVRPHWNGDPRSCCRAAVPNLGTSAAYTGTSVPNTG